ncbi:hypothetical protein EG68_00856 [Paragonimus skrjabini miyazakii]|uniref:Uncharacterized protein n=1 Tax=Paragonimus skrjabini miyazakii TaxID=59628 RepID=A0A8S9Z8Z0_9TREM|nr:hypothetical protein EG68_00856 [Paragonimus skrjabini miyazakii]
MCGCYSDKSMPEGQYESMSCPNKRVCRILISIMDLRTRALFVLVTLFVSEIHSRDLVCNLKACSICSGYNLNVETCCQFEAMHSLCEECVESTDDPIELQVCLEDGHPSVSKRRGLLGKRSLEKRRGMIGK